MRTRTLIVGSGITAGLAANMLSRDDEINLSFFPLAMFSTIPEIVPRRPFFDALGVSPVEEHLVVSDVATRLSEVIWIDGKFSAKRLLKSTNDFLIYDKGLLASWLLNRAIQRGVQVVKSNEHLFGIQFECNDYDKVLDCRGANAVTKDFGYKINQDASASTYCTYAIIKKSHLISNDQMIFWSDPNRHGFQRTFFCIPCNSDSISLGVSYSEGDRVDMSVVLEAAHTLGYQLLASDIIFTADISPHRYSASHTYQGVIPVGDAARSSCPLKEYGVMSALSQLLQMRGGLALLPSQTKRPVSRQIDPHIPMELFI